MQQQLDEGDYKIDTWKEKTLLDKLHKKLIKQLQAMDIDMDHFKEKRKYLVLAPMLGHMETAAAPGVRRFLRKKQGKKKRFLGGDRHLIFTYNYQHLYFGFSFF